MLSSQDENKRKENMKNQFSETPFFLEAIKKKRVKLGTNQSPTP